MKQDDRLYSNALALLEDLRSKGMKLVAPVDVDMVAKQLNIMVINDASLEAKGIIGEILFQDCNPVVKINPLQNSYEPRRRFTLAHEIGHYCLHSAKSREGFTDSQKTMSRSESFWDRRESEANSFAAQLLMPKSLILQEGQVIIDAHMMRESKAKISAMAFIEAMADKFEVSSKAMEYRLKNLGIVK